MRVIAPGVVGLVALWLAACGAGTDGSAGARAGANVKAATASSGVRWLCGEGVEGEGCRSADLTATELRADGSRERVAHRASARPPVDCFYVYPTVDLELVPGNHANLAENRSARMATVAQAARFSEVCALWVPLYRQVTLGTYLQPADVLERGLRIAFSDVESAFAEYLARSDGSRKMVLIGHSQGAEMIVRLLRKHFDTAADAAMRARLLLALPIGAEVDVAAGRTTGGTFANIPVCTQPNETGCVVAYRTHAAGEPVDPDRWAPPQGRETVCVNPAALDTGAAPSEPRLLSRAYYALWPELRRFMFGVSDVTTPFVVLRDAYLARCVRGTSGYAYLEVRSAPPPPPPRAPDGSALRPDPVDLHDRRFKIGKLGLHVLDMQLAQGDLVDLVARRVKGAR